MDMTVVKEQELETSELAKGDGQSGSDGGNPKNQNVEDAERWALEDSRTATYIEAGTYTDQEIEILAASLHVSPAGSISETPAAATATAADHDRRFITLVRPPPNDPIADPSDNSVTGEVLYTEQTQQLQSPSSTTSQSASPTRNPAPNRGGLQVLFPKIVTPTSGSGRRMMPSSTSRTAPQVSPSTGFVETPPALESSPVSSALTGPSMQAEKQPNASPTLVGPSIGLSRAGEVGIVIGSIAGVCLLLGAGLFFYYKHKTSGNNIFTSQNKNLTPQMSISRPVLQGIPNRAAANLGRPTPAPFARPSPPRPPRSPRPYGGAPMTERPQVYARPEEPLPAEPVQRSFMNRN